jgi:diaminohydroxyphosphoribosylaminopyrimidine deaminase / 5-amino-6-(5-phosphoribosylamino)uracil reductase
MAEALRLAATIPRRPWPNPPVGAVVVRDGHVVGRGAHHGPGTDHAEVVALRDAGPMAKGATLYCTLEPCNHLGRTPPCAPLVAQSGIARLVVSITDPNPHVCGGGIDVVRQAGIEVESGVLGAEGLELVWPFVATSAFERPFVIVKTAESCDGLLAPPAESRRPGEPVYLTGPAARRDVHCLRRWSDVVVVGRETMARDRPRLDGRLVGRSEPCPTIDPVPAYVDTGLGLQAGWTRPFWVFTGSDRSSPSGRSAIERSGGTVVVCAERNGRVDPASIVSEFGRRGGCCLMVEGGPRLALSFFESGVVDRWVSYVAPEPLEGGEAWPGGRPAWPGSPTRSIRIDADEKSVYDRTSFFATLAALGTASREGR